MAAADRSASVRKGVGTADTPSFLSESRRLRFDLLLHLAVNLSQPIVVTGSSGIGKTHYLHALAARMRPYATVCYLPCTAATTYDQILAELGRAGSVAPPRPPAGPAESPAKLSPRLALLLDDADALLPGLLNAVGELAQRYTGLRLVFSMAPEEFQQKSSTDALALAEAFVLEIPVLNDAEGFAFLRNVAALRPGARQPKHLDEPWVQQVMESAQGSPGAILDLTQQAPKQAQASGGRRVGHWLAGGIVVFAGAALLFSASKMAGRLPWPRLNEEPAAEQPPAQAGPNATTPVAGEEPPAAAPPVVAGAAPLAEAAVNPPSESPPPTATPPAGAAPNAAPETPAEAPAGSGPIAETEPAPVPAAQQPQASIPADIAATDRGPQSGNETGAGSEQAATAAPPTEPVSTAASVANPAPEQAPAATPESPAGATAETAADGLHGADWLLAQDPAAYTLQLAAVNREEALTRMVREFPPGSAHLATFRSRKGRSDLYPLLYGVFPDLAAAKQAISSLPPGLNRPFPRQMKSVQQEIQRMLPRDRTRPPEPAGAFPPKSDP